MSTYARQRLHAMLVVAAATFVTLLALGKGVLYASLFIVTQAVLSVPLGNAWIRRTRPKIDARRTHQLEYELGFRDDPPPRELKFGPGAIIPIDGPPPSWMKARSFPSERARQLAYVKRSPVRLASPAERRAINEALRRRYRSH